MSGDELIEIRKMRAADALHHPKRACWNPKWLTEVSNAKLQEIWKSRERVFYESVEIRAHIRIYGVERFFAEHRDEILFGEDLERDMKQLEALLVKEKLHEDRMMLQRVLLRIKRENRPVDNAFTTVSSVYKKAAALRNYRVREAGANYACFNDAMLGPRLFKFAFVPNARLQHVNSSFKSGFKIPTLELNIEERKRCRRLDAIETTVFGAEREAAEKRRLAKVHKGDWVPPPIADFITHPLYDQNVWRIIGYLLHENKEEEEEEENKV